MNEIAFLIFLRDKLNVEIAQQGGPNDRLVEMISLITARIERLSQFPTIDVGTVNRLMGLLSNEILSYPANAPESIALEKLMDIYSNL